MSDDKRYISVEESIIEACKEVKLMREGKLPERTWADFEKELKKMVAEEETNANKHNTKIRVRR